jgi:secondary thiamine-phosphate synthase enzyme|tara:strand:+ start:87 stop:491 length:405 start_codon:yes stop_codon:yes gene_type:complete
LIEQIEVKVDAQGLHDITKAVAELVAAKDLAEGLCTIFIQHTSASLVIQENYEPSARYDLEQWLNKLVPEDPSLYTHTTEGPDDMPAHIKSALTLTSIGIPIIEGKMVLGTWQGIFLWEHRHHPGTRKVLVHLS